jgi:mxaK protein
MDRLSLAVALLRRAWPGLLLAAALVLLASDGQRLWHAQQLQDAVRSATTHSGPTPLEAHPSLLFARAHGAAQAGRTQEALALYLAAARDPRLAAAAHYNSANLHLREALALAMEGKLAANPQSVELAKSRFRQALRQDPGLAPARYNLERALWLAPELPDEEPPAPPPLQSERAVTTMRGFTLGLP